ncbi:MAG: hypothetical protein ACR2LF_01610 [Jatrophihabitantaceae bacterium]
MSEIVVWCRSWLGVTKRYVVRVDGREIGRLGRGAKQATTATTPGRHSVVVDYNGQATPEQHVDVAPDESAHFEALLTYPWVV